MIEILYASFSFSSLLSVRTKIVEVENWSWEKSMNENRRRGTLKKAFSYEKQTRVEVYCVSRDSFLTVIYGLRASFF